MSDEKTPAEIEQDDPHAHWDKVVSAAYLRIIGHTQQETADAVGRHERTVRTWESNVELWTKAREAARDRWLLEVTDAARTSVLKGARRNPDMGMKVLERIDPAFAPKTKHELTGKDGGPIETESKVAFYIPENQRSDDK